MREEKELIVSLVEDAGLTEAEALSYMKILKKGSIPREEADNSVLSLAEKGMLILSADDKRYIPTHPRLAVANQYRTWREKMVREINERRMRIDKLILELIPIYERTKEGKESGKV